MKKTPKDFEIQLLMDIEKLLEETGEKLMQLTSSWLYFQNFRNELKRRYVI